jgi:transcriptional regulator with PAS, ATPase and Fis domain
MIPPLRQRKGDIPALVHHFIDRKSMELKLKERPKLASYAIDMLTAYDWPGNVRELENTIERALIQHHSGGPLSFEALLPLATPGNAVRGQSKDEPLVSLDEMNARYIRRALEQAGGKIYGPGGAAQILSINPGTLRKRMDKLGILYGRKSWRPDLRA